MANYRIGDVVRLARRSVGMSQEELAYQAGVATETISRIESGKHKVTQATYQKVMEPLNRFLERSYAVCVGRDIEIFEEKRLLEEAELKFEYEKAAEHIRRLKKSVEDTVANRQYIMRAEAINNYNRGVISAEVYVEQLEEALGLTITDYREHMTYKEYSEDGYPFTEQEILILMNLAGAFDECDLPEKAIEISRLLLDCLKSGYIAGEDIGNLALVIKRNLTFSFQRQGRYEEAVLLSLEVLEEALKCKYGLMISFVLYDITWSMEHINKISIENKYNWNEIKRKKRQAYYIAAARNDDYIKKFIKESFERLFHEKIEL
ncbi:MAG: helix-turn-helix transcriptional regulator [Lachnospiraceae bacterium]|nr:helix-turn-helix transcriptional regulator [Lachnospiraceae bacterium]